MGFMAGWANFSKAAKERLCGKIVNSVKVKLSAKLGFAESCQNIDY